MILRSELVSYLNNFLACDQFSDYAPNGLQIEGRNDIQRICTAVTASLDAIQKATQLKADALLVHHGYFWRGEDPVITGVKYQRIAHLIRSDINLLAYHLPLDCHLDLGNNACLAKLLPLKELSIQQHNAGKTNNLLWSAELLAPQTAEKLQQILTQTFQRESILIQANSKPIQTLAWCTGAAEDFIVEAHQLGVDAFISGEVSERTYYLAQELGIHYFACGHHATERFGIQALGDYLANRFNLKHTYIECNNPI